MIVIASLVILGGSYGISNNCFTLTVKPITEAYGFSRSAYTFCVTIRCIFYMLAAGFSGRIFSKVRPIVLVRLSLILLAAAHALQAFTRSLGVFYILYVIIGLLSPLCSFSAFTVIISNWFKMKRGTAIGISFMGSGIGGMVFSTLSGLWIDKYGMNTTYLIQTVCMLVMTLPLAFFLLCERPEDMGLRPYGEEKELYFGSETAVYGYTVRDGLRKKNFWLLMLIPILIGFVTNLPASNISAHFSDLGFSAVYAANMNSAYLGAVSVMKIVLGMMFDRINTKAVAVFGVSGSILGAVGCLFGQYPAVQVLLILGMSVGGAMATISYPILVTYGAGNRDYVAICGLLTAFGSLGSAISPVVANGIYDAEHSYNNAFIVTIAVAVVSIILILLLREVRRQKR